MIIPSGRVNEKYGEFQILVQGEDIAYDVGMKTIHVEPSPQRWWFTGYAQIVGFRYQDHPTTFWKSISMEHFGQLADFRDLAWRWYIF
jgi:hypothetical protein